MVSKEGIKQAAFELFAEKGYEATSTQDIAEAVGLKKQSLYSHFKSKSEIFTEVLNDQSTIIQDELKASIEANQNRPAEAFLKMFFEALIQSFSAGNRLLFLKRAILLYASKSRRPFIEEFILKFSGTLKNSLYVVLSTRYGVFTDPKKFQTFYSYLMLHVYGYIEIMLTGEADECFYPYVWEKFWKSSEAFFIF